MPMLKKISLVIATAALALTVVSGSTGVVHSAAPKHLSAPKHL